ncbi:uncharacterized protein AMSG_12371 [Thecamonas trahens ATCC 50062]|uniref:VCBS repeat-containing protein n=1 Tax=Thecamonas trahens ATCC 50062 TaxID=461836 RepID=A0A0L0DRV0_THETB|nr:hypothetical protein AMSG_12371 [Thecamonas trahens ATCC 50062]KNC55020.1 hypothetical protein AMSG_12371 [Thecamonas trahens ATCC 50062]|eukprot:XP_013753378.1 hypothetical protein AMSG_12371 [Thecamonas trahens ATCC 50062]
MGGKAVMNMLLLLALFSFTTTSTHGQPCPATDAAVYGTSEVVILGSTLFTSQRLFETAVDIDCDGRRDVAAHSRYGMTFLPSSSPFTRQYPSTAGVPVDGVAQFEPADEGMKLSGCIAAEMGPAGMQADTWATPVYVSGGSQAALSSSGVYDAWAGDLNGDGVPEFVTAEDVGLKAMVGSMTTRWPKYTDAITMASGYSTVRGVQQQFDFADMDNDGDIDLVWWSRTSHTDETRYHRSPRWFANHGNGTFDSPGTTIFSFSVGSYVALLALGDVNGDNFPDVAWHTYQDTTHIVHTIGPGVFSSTVVTLTPDWENCHSLKLFDVDGDGDIDVVRNANVEGKLFAYLNVAGPGADFVFGSTMTIMDRNDARGFDVGDIDNDGDLDVVASSYTDDVLIILRGDGAGGYSMEDTLRLDGLYSVELADVNNDTYLDVVGKRYGSNMFMALYNSDDDTYDALISFSGMAIFPSGWNLVDMDGDGMLDLVGFSLSLTGSTEGGTLFYYRNMYPDVASVFDDNRPIPLLGGVKGFGGPLVADFNGDGAPDYLGIHANMHLFDLAIYLAAGPGTSAGGAGKLAFNGGQQTLGFVLDEVIEMNVDDYDGDGDYDFVYATYSSFSRSTVEYLSNAYGGIAGSPLAFSAAVTLGESKNSREVAVELIVNDADGDGNAREVVVGWRSLSSFGSNSYGYVTLYEVDDWASGSPSVNTTMIADDMDLLAAVVVVDMDLDGSLDLVVAERWNLYALLSGGGALRELATSGQRLFLGEIQTSRSQYVLDLAVASLNPGEDTHLDIVGLVSSSEPVVMMGLPGNSSARVRVKDHVRMPSVVNGARGLVLTDYDSDSFVDVVFATIDGFKWQPNLGYPAATKGAFQVTSASYGIPTGCVADFNRDSRLDLVYYRSDDSVLGKLHVHTNVPDFTGRGEVDFVGRIHRLVAADVDMDGLVDLLFLMASGDVIGWMPNLGVFPFFDAATAVQVINTTDVVEHPEDMVAMLLDGDEFIDLVVLGRDSGNLAILRGNPTLPKRFEEPVELVSWSTTQCSWGYRLALVDVTADGMMDMFMACYTSGFVVWFESLGPTNDAPWSVKPLERIADTPGTWKIYDVEMVDLTGDGLVDFVFSIDEATTSSVMYEINIGNATHPVWGPTHRVSSTVAWGVFTPLDTDGPSHGLSLESADLDMDGHIDIVLSSALDRTGVLLNQTPRLPASAFNDSPDEGEPRLASATRWTDNANYRLRGQARELYVADIDADGFPDWIAVSDHLERAGGVLGDKLGVADAAAAYDVPGRG